MFKDINMDDLRNVIITTNSNGKTITTDDRYSLLRNYMINYFVKDTEFFKQFKGKRIYDRIEMEKKITETIKNRIADSLKNQIKIETLIVKNKALILAFMVSKSIYEKDKLLFDFEIVL